MSQTTLLGGDSRRAVLDGDRATAAPRSLSVLSCAVLSSGVLKVASVVDPESGGLAYEAPLQTLLIRI